MFEISTYADLKKVGTGVDGWDLDSDYKLMNDIDASDSEAENEGAGWIPIGRLSGSFTGTFDGQGYTISNLYMDESDYDGAGFFGSLSSATIQNLRLVGMDILSDYVAGGLAGYSTNSTITNCSCSGSVEERAGGDNFIGGLVGQMSGGQMARCYSAVNVIGVSQYAGGLFGYFSTGSVLNSYATGSVSGEDYVGGFAGYNYRGIIQKCYSTGAVSGEDDVGGFCGDEDTGGDYDTQDNFFDYETAGNEVEIGATKKTTADMKNIDTFTDTETAGLTEAWDMEYRKFTGGNTIWIISGDYPELGWAWEGLKSPLPTFFK
jgi:hypothetical protein